MYMDRYPQPLPPRRVEWSGRMCVVLLVCKLLLNAHQILVTNPHDDFPLGGNSNVAHSFAALPFCFCPAFAFEYL